MTVSVKLSFFQACEYLSLSPAEFTALRKVGLVAQIQGAYEQANLKVCQRLLEIGAARDWSPLTLAWYADLLFAASIGRTIFLPLREQAHLEGQAPETWLAMQYATPVLEALMEGVSRCDENIVTPIASLVTQAIGEGQFWPDVQALTHSNLTPIIRHLESHGTRLLDHEGAYQRDAGIVYVAMMFTFKLVARPLSVELAELVEKAQSGMNFTGQNVTPEEEQTLIKQETLIAVDKLYASKATEIHIPPELWESEVGVLRANRRTITIQARIPDDTNDAFIDNILDIVRPYLGTFGARVVQLLYEIANDAPYYRTPVVTVNTNEMLDRLGLKRDARGVHQARNRERLRDTINAAHLLEILGEYTVWEDGELTRKMFRRTVLSILGASFSRDETSNLSTFELHTRGLPKSIQIRLNFYDGIRRPDGKPGNQFLLMPRLAETQKLKKANYSNTYESLKSYVLFRFRQTRMVNRTFSLTRKTALEKANIKNKNVTRATQTLVKALNRLVVDGILDEYGTVPLDPSASFEVTLSEKAARTPD